jgi:hypothetical protein
MPMDEYPSDMPQERIAAEAAALFAQGWRVDDSGDSDVFLMTSPRGTAYTVRGIHLPPLDDDRLPVDLWMEWQQLEEDAALRLCDLVVRFRFCTDTILTNERCAAGS